MVLALAFIGCAPKADPDAAILIGAGDIAVCNREDDEATAAMIAEMDGTVFTLGDNVYDDATLEEFETCYENSWGRFKDRTYPSVGNHEYWTEGAAGYWEYFGEAAGEAGKGWYSYDLGEWHIIVLNSECEFVGCDADSEQGQWLKADLEANTSICTLAYWHRPRFSIGGGFDDRSAYFWDVLYEHNADLIVNGHDHHYVRFAPQNPAGERDDERGIRQIIVGTGGAELYGFDSEDGVENVEARNKNTFGIIKLSLSADRYAWEFIPSGGLFRDSGSEECH